jgi:hypothetical protein
LCLATELVFNMDPYFEYDSVTCNIMLCNKTLGTVACRVVRATKIMGSSSDDWIYWHFGYNLS